jgi:RNase P subunit RPR2
MTEEQKERRRKQANAIRVLASPVHMPMEEFQNRYLKQHFLISNVARRTIEHSTQHMFCDECVEEQHGGLALRYLHVTIEDDPLRNFWKLATMRCYGCGFEEIIPLERPAFAPDDFNTVGVMSPGHIVPYKPTLTSQIVNDPWTQEYEHQRQVFAQQAQAAQAARQSAIQQQQLAQMAQMKLAEKEFMLRGLDKMIYPPIITGPSEKSEEHVKLIDRLANAIFKDK